MLDPLIAAYWIDIYQFFCLRGSRTSDEKTDIFKKAKVVLIIFMAAHFTEFPCVEDKNAVKMKPFHV